MSDLQTLVLSRVETTHAGLATAFAGMQGGRVRWPEGADPLLFCEGRWQESRTLLDRRVADFCASVQAARRAVNPDDTVPTLRSSSGIAAVIARLPSEPGIYCAADAFDSDPCLLGAANGIVDLRTGAVVPSTPDLMISRFARGRYLPGHTPEGLAKDWLDAIHWALPGDGVADYLQLLTGASLFGTNRVKMFLYLWGVTDAGKSSFTDPLLRALGDYSAAGSVALVAGKQAKGSEHTEHLLPMAQRRIVMVPEVDSALTLNGGQIKALSGDGEMTMRAAYGKGGDRLITATLWMMGNPQSPKFDPSDIALVNRLQVIPFNRQRKGADLDPAKLDAMRSDPAVHDTALTWAIDGARRFHADPDLIVTARPPEVAEATIQYVDQHDELGVWLDTHTRACAPDEMGTRRSELLGNLHDWERTQHIAERLLTTPRGFAGAMRARGYSERKIHGYPVLNVMLKEDGPCLPAL